MGASCWEDLASGAGAEEHLGPQATAECGGVRGVRGRTAAAEGTEGSAACRGQPRGNLGDSALRDRETGPREAVRNSPGVF